MHGDVKYRYVDGGYFEASGAASLLEILNSLRADSRDDFEPIVIRVGFTERSGVEAARGSQGFDEFLGPIRAVLNTLATRDALVSAQLETAITMLQDQGRYANMYSFEFNESKSNVHLPLGWLLSQEARNELARQIETPLPFSQQLDISNNAGKLTAIMATLDPDR